VTVLLGVLLNGESVMNRYYQCAKILEEEDSEWSKLPQSEREIVTNALSSPKKWEEFMAIPTPSQETTKSENPLSSDCLAVRNKEIVFSDILNFRVRSIVSNQIIAWTLLGVYLL
jgi:hypothetical protein